MLPRSIQLLAVAVCVGLATLPVSAEDADAPRGRAPDEVTGLAAWYDARTLYDTLRDRAPVERWSDASGNGHDLTEEGNGVPSRFRTLQVGEKPAVEIGEASSFAVAQPFPLEDHTIFVVYRAGQASIGLFSGARDALHGVVLAQDGKQHLLLAGNSSTRYNDAATTADAGAGFSITVLAREGGTLRAWVDGRDVTAGAGDATPLEVGRLFHAALSRAVSRDATGMRLAELIFYRRHLDDAERDAVTAHLAQKYALQLAPPPAPVERPPYDWSQAEPQASLASSSAANLNVPGLAIAWDKALRTNGPFRFDPERPTRLYCDRDAVVHVSLRLSLRTTAEDTRLRLILLRNDQDWLVDDEAHTRPDPNEPPGTRLVGRLDATVELQAGGWIEAIASQAGAAGEVTLLAGESALLAIAE